MVILGKLFLTLFFAAKKNTQDRLIIAGILSGYFGLLINATMIDIFEASKIAFMFWMIMGITIGYLNEQNVKLKVKGMQI